MKKFLDALAHPVTVFAVGYTMGVVVGRMI